MTDAPSGSRHARGSDSVDRGSAGSVSPAPVSVVLVGHNGARWLPQVTSALQDLTVRPHRVVAVDTGSRDDTATLMRDAFGAESVLTIGTDVGFGAAVQAAVELLDRQPAASPPPLPQGPEWLWLLHDDCVPAPEALEALLAVAGGTRLRRHRRAHSESHDAAQSGAGSAAGEIGIVGPKVLGWTDRRLLLELGLTISRSGRRETGLEPGEEDQGQHDERERVLAVGTAGMLIRRDVFDALGGFDPQLPLFRDDVDLGWRANLAGYQVRVASAAVVHHVQAASGGRRTIDAGSHRRHFADRRNALYVLLANLPARDIPLAYLRLVLGSIVRTVGFALGKLPGAAVDELSAMAVTLARPDVVARARAARRPLRSVPERDSVRRISTLLAPRSAQLQRVLDSVAGVFDRGSHASADLSARGHRAAESGGVDEDGESLETNAAMWLRWLRHPGVLLFVGALLVSLVASRGLFGAGRLMDGALLPAPDGAADLWHSYVSAWHDVGLGSSAGSPPYLAVLAGLATVLGGKASLAIDVVMLGAVPMCAVFAYAAARKLVADVRVRLWIAATYATLPATTGAIAGGRIGTVVALVLLPLLALAAAAAGGTRQRPGTWSGTCVAALILAAMSAFVPMAYVAVVAILLGGAAFARSWQVAARVAAVVVVTPALLLPWSAQVWRHPDLLLLEAGLPGPGLSDSRLPPASVVFQASGGPGSIPIWLGVPLVLGGLAAVLGSERRGVVLAAWAVVMVGVALGIGVSLATVSTATTQTPAAGWPGFAAGLVATGLLVASAVTAESARTRLAASSFGWRQPMAVGLTAVVAAAPLLLAGWWVVRGADGPLDRRDPVVLPEFVAATGSGPDRPRTIVLRRATDGSVTYALLRDVGPRLGDAETGPPADTYGALDRAVTDLVSGRGGDLASELARHAVRYVLIATPGDDDLVGSLDSVPTLHRLATSGGSALWELSLTAARLRLDAADGATLTSLPSGPEGAQAAVPRGGAGRTVVLAERADPRWIATLDGAALDGVVVDGWAQGFPVPSSGGELVIKYDETTRHRWMLTEGALVLVVVVLGLPGARRRSSELEP